jgi:hypothetical protein
LKNPVLIPQQIFIKETGERRNYRRITILKNKKTKQKNGGNL